MASQGMEESLTRSSDKGQDEDMEQQEQSMMMEGRYRSSKDNSEDDSDSDDDNNNNNNSSGMDEDQQEQPQWYPKKDAMGEYFREFDKRVADMFADDMARLFGTLSMGEPATEEVGKEVAKVNKEDDNKEEKLDSNDEAAKRKKEQLEAEMKKKLKEGTPQDLELLKASLTTQTGTNS